MRTLKLIVILIIIFKCSGNVCSQSCVFYIDYETTKIYFDGKEAIKYFKGDWLEKDWLKEIVMHNDTVHSFNDFISTIENKDSLQVHLDKTLPRLIDKRKVIFYYKGKKVDAYYRKRFKEKTKYSKKPMKGYSYYIKGTGEEFFSITTKPGVIKHFLFVSIWFIAS